MPSIDSILVNLKGNYMVVFLSVILGYILFYIDGVVTKKQHSKNDYLKVGIYSIGLSWLIMYINTLKPITEEIIQGPAPF